MPLPITQHIETIPSIHCNNFKLRIRSTHKIISNQHTWVTIFKHSHCNITNNMFRQLTLNSIQHPFIRHSVLSYTHKRIRRWFHFLLQLRHHVKQTSTQHCSCTTRVHHSSGFVTIYHHINVWYISLYWLMHGYIPLSSTNSHYKRFLFRSAEVSCPLHQVRVLAKILGKVVCLVLVEVGSQRHARHILINLPTWCILRRQRTLRSCTWSGRLGSAVTRLSRRGSYTRLTLSRLLLLHLLQLLNLRRHCIMLKIP